jgi:cytochrome c-type biogenesis protein CcmH/NrfG
MLHNSYYESVRGQVTDKVLPGKDGEVAATLVLIADKLRRQAVVKATLVEHDALMMLQKAVEVQPKNVRCLEELGAAYQRIKDQERAVQTYRKLLELDPNHAEARQYLESVGAPLTAPPAPAEATSQPGG